MRLNSMKVENPTVRQYPYPHTVGFAYSVEIACNGTHEAEAVRRIFADIWDRLNADVTSAILNGVAAQTTEVA